MESTILLKKTRRSSMPAAMDRRVHFHRGVSVDKSEAAPVKKVLTRNNTCVGAVSTSKQVVNVASSNSVMDDLVECPICYERLTSPKMLPCQHTFCQACLQAIDKGKFLTCPTCNLEVHLTPSVAELPANLYLNSLLTALAQQTAALQTAQPAAQTRCSSCQTVGKGPICQHCRQVFCHVCWPKHVADLRLQLGSLSEQLQGAGERLKHRAQDFKDQCEKLHEHIDEAVEVKIAELRAKQKKLIAEAREIETKGDESANELQDKLVSAEDNVSFLSFDKVTEASEKVNLFLLLHTMAADLLNEVSHWNEARPAFDRDSFSIHYLDDRGEGEEGGEEEGETFELPKKQEEQILSPDGLSLHYRSRRFTTPRLTIDRSILQRPAGVGVAPWSDSTIYIAGTDNRQVLVLDRLKGKLVSRLSAPDMLCPQGLAFSSTRIYVTDKWNHRIHVFDSSGAYVKTFGKKGNGECMLRSPEGIAVGPNPNVQENAGDDENVLLYVCDTGNDRLQVLRASDGSYVKSIGILRTFDDRGKLMTELNQPTGVAVTEHKIVVTDCGNRIRVYSLSGVKMLEFGSYGGGRGQFRSPECVAVDHMGFILVGDSGNKRVQIFRPNGNLVQTIGGRAAGDWKFGWVSGLVIAENMDIIVTDSKNRSVHIF